MKNKKNIFYIIIIIILFIALFYYFNKRIKYYNFNYDWTTNSNYICHALGEINGDVYTNSLEAFEHNYSLGQRIFEIDFDITTDNYIICSHDEETWRRDTNKDDEYSFSNFTNNKIMGKYTPLSLEDFLLLLNNYKDVYIITDTKYDDKKNVEFQFNNIVSCAKKIDQSMLNRIIPQIYNEDMLDIIMNIYPFDSVIFTLYKVNNFKASNIVTFCKKSGIGMIVCSEYKVLDDNNINIWKNNNLIVATHTINEKSEAEEYFNAGVDMIYTDNLIE